MAVSIASMTWVSLATKATKSFRLRTARRALSVTVALAERSIPSINAISPKKSPSPSSVSVTSWPSASDTAIRTRASFDQIHRVAFFARIEDTPRRFVFAGDEQSAKPRGGIVTERAKERNLAQLLELDRPARRGFIVMQIGDLNLRFHRHTGIVIKTERKTQD